MLFHFWGRVVCRSLGFRWGGLRLALLLVCVLFVFLVLLACWVVPLFDCFGSYYYLDSFCVAAIVFGVGFAFVCESHYGSIHFGPCSL